MSKSVGRTAVLIVLAVGAISAQSAGVILNEGFDSPTPSTFNSRYYGNLAGSQFRIQSAVRANGVSALEHRIPAYTDVQYASQHFGDARAAPLLAAGAGLHFYDVYVQYKAYYPVGFDRSRIPKQLIIGTEDDRRHENVCCNPWVANYIFTFPPFGANDQLGTANNKWATTGQWIGLGQNASGYGPGHVFTIQLGRWYTYEVRIRLNDASSDNGIFQEWIDGVLIADHRNIKFRTPWNGTFGSNFNYGTNFVMITDYVADGQAHIDESVFYDDIKISDSYIGVGSGSGLPSRPTNLRVVPGLDSLLDLFR